MTNEELIEEIYAGRKEEITKLYNKNKGLIRSISKETAKAFNCFVLNERTHKITSYTRDILSELDSVGCLELLETVNEKSYDSAVSKFTTYIYPRIKGKMYDWMRSNLGCMYVPDKAMADLRKAQRMYHTDGKSTEKISEELDEPLETAVKDISLNTHFLSVYDLVPYEKSKTYDPFETLMPFKLSAPANVIAYRHLCIEYLKLLFEKLSEKDKSLLGRYFGVFGYKQESLDDIALMHTMTVSGVVKAQKAAIKRLRKLYPTSMLKLFRTAYHAVMREAEKASCGFTNT